MPIATRTFRVFVSSTFEDLKEERDALQREVFPKLRTLCEQHGARFQAIDLRWGVRDEAALDQQTVEICLHEIRRCQATGVRPNFIVLLGDRYGWQPLPASVPAAELEALLPLMTAGGARALAAQWYWLDENAIPPEYCLQRRTGEFVAPIVWTPVEQTLREFLAKAARAAGSPEKELIKYEASATHQEILAGLGDTEADRQHVFAFVRPSTGATDPRVEELKSLLRVHVFDPAVVHDQLRQMIEAEIKRFEDRPALDLEVEAHDRFAADRCRIFTGRQAVLDTIADYIRGPERRPLVLHGESGSGKSAVMAKASQQYQGSGRVIRRFIGASPESASGHALLTSLCRQIAPGETPVDYAQLENAFRERLSAAAAEQPLVLFIDALDQLTAGDQARDLTWLPPDLPPHVKVIVSTTDVGERLPEGMVVRLEPMTQPEGGQALTELLHEAHRRLQPWQRDKVLAHFERCGLPLYLKLAAEESWLWKSYAPEDACTLGEGVAGVIDTLFDRLASNANHGPVLVERSLGYLAAARHGLTEDEVLDVLTADDTVWSDFDQRKHHEVSERRLPVVVWSRLSLDLEPYLAERAAPGGTVIAFFHRQLAERAATGQTARHTNLARYFSAQPAWLDAERKTPNARRAVELPFQQREARDWTAVEATLFDCQFLLAKCAAGLAVDLEADYRAVLTEKQGEALRLVHGALVLSMHVVVRDWRQYASQMVGRLLGLDHVAGVGPFVEELTAEAPRPWLRALRATLHPPGTALLRTLEGHDSWVLGVAVTSDGRRAVSASGDETLKVWDLTTGQHLLTMKGHSGDVNNVAVVSNGQRAVSASSDNTLKLWDLESGRVLRTLEGHTGSVHDVAITSNGKSAVSASDDKTLKVWDLESGRVLLTLDGHSSWVRGVAITADGKRAVSASHDKTLKVWSLETGHLLRTLEGHTEAVRDVAVTPDGKSAVSASDDHTLMMWDLDVGRTLLTLKGHSESVPGVALTMGGRRAISASSDKRLIVWDLETGRRMSTLDGHSFWVSAVAATPDGKFAVSASCDNTLKVWDLAIPATSGGGHLVSMPEGHSSFVNGLSVVPDGKRVVSASSDKTLKIWDPATGYVLSTLRGHSSQVTGVAITPDGKRAVSAAHDHTLKVWDLDSGRTLRTMKEDPSYFNALAVTPDGKHAVSASGDCGLKVWDLETGRAICALEGHSSYVNGVAITRDGRRVVSASSDRTLRVWDLHKGTALLTLRGHLAEVCSVAVMPDGKRAISASGDHTLKVWDLESGRVLRTLAAHSSWVLGVAVTPSGRRAVSVSGDETLIVWDLERPWERGHEPVLATFHCGAPVRCCALVDNRRIVAGDTVGNVHFFALED